MGSLPLAFSVHHFISTVGADVGFASLIGLAILVLLYFAQARETATLRGHAEEAAQRIQELEARVISLGRGAQAAGAQQPGAQAAGAASRVVPAPPGAVVPASAAVPTGVPSISRAVSPAPLPPLAPAGVGAPALAAATKLIPASSSPAPAPAPTSSPAQVGQPAASPQQPQAPQPPPPVVVPQAPAAATVAGGRSNGSGEARVQPRPAPAVAAAAAAPPRIQIRPSAAAPPRRGAPVARAGSRGAAPSSRGRAILFGLLSLIGLAAVILILLQLTSSSGGTASNPSAVSRTTNTPTTGTAHSTGVVPSSMTVAVLNGTPTSGLAHRVALKLSGTGYKEGTVATATDQTRTATIVAYLPGFRRDALAVAASLKLQASAVAPVDQQTQAVACPPPNACNANVVVTVGSDLAGTQ